MYASKQSLLVINVWTYLVYLQGAFRKSGLPYAESLTPSLIWNSIDYRQKFQTKGQGNISSLQRPGLSLQFPALPHRTCIAKCYHALDGHQHIFFPCRMGT